MPSTDLRAKTAVAALVIAALMVAPSTAGADTLPSTGMVEFEGSGWGHGVGLSQWGAYGMASEGAGYQNILTHYYQGASITPIGIVTSLWVNLELDFATLDLMVGDVGSSAGAPVSITSPAGSLIAQTGATISLQDLGSSSCSVTVTNPSAVASTVTDTSCQFDFSWYAWSTPGINPTTKIEITGCTNADWNVSPTLYRPCQYARGTLHLRSGAGGLDLSAEMLLEDYVLGISEIPVTWHPEALKAQAVASRTYARALKLRRGDPASNSCAAWCHVRDSTFDQRYVGWGHTVSTDSLNAVSTTAGLVITHPDAPEGAIVAYYSSSSGGKTENAHERLSNITAPLQYLSSVDDTVAVDGTVPNPNASWTTSLTSGGVAAAVGLDSISDVSITDYRTSGSAAEVTFTGYLAGTLTSIAKTGTWTRENLGLKSEYFSVSYTPSYFLNVPGEEMFFYDTGGTFKYYTLNTNGQIGAPINSGTGYSPGWDIITAIDLDGDGQDEIFFYDDSGVFKYYDVGSNGTIGGPINSGIGYTTGWDVIEAVNIDGDPQDEIFFYRKDGLFRYYDIGSNGIIGAPKNSGTGYSAAWATISAIDLDGDGADEMLFYKKSGVFKYYNVTMNGSIGAPVNAGTGYTSGWDSITSIDLEGDVQDEIFFYRQDGTFNYYDIGSTGVIGAPINSGSDYSPGWDTITSIQLD